METEKQILIEYLSQNGFSKDSAALYVSSLFKNPDEPTNLKFNSILGLIKFATNISTIKDELIDNVDFINDRNLYQLLKNNSGEIVLNNHQLPNVENGKVIGYLNKLISIYDRQVDNLLECQDEKDLGDMAKAEMQLNIDYFKAEITDISKIVKSLEE